MGIGRLTIFDTNIHNRPTLSIQLPPLRVRTHSRCISYRFSLSARISLCGVSPLASQAQRPRQTAEKLLQKSVMGRYSQQAGVRKMAMPAPRELTENLHRIREGQHMMPRMNGEVATAETCTSRRLIREALPEDHCSFRRLVHFFNSKPPCHINATDTRVLSGILEVLLSPRDFQFLLPAGVEKTTKLHWPRVTQRKPAREQEK